MRTFLYHDGALGDLLLSVPCFRTIGRDGGKLHLAGPDGTSRLLQKAGLVQEVSSAGGAIYASLFGAAPDERLSAFLAAFGSAVVFSTDAGSGMAAAVGTVVPSTSLIVTVPPPSVVVHAAEFRLSQVSGSSGFSEDLARLVAPPGARERAGSMLAAAGIEPQRPVIVIHPGSGGRRKCWPLGRFLSLSRSLRRKDERYAIVHLTGPAEDRSVRERIEKSIGGEDGIVHLAGLDLETAAGLLDTACLYVGNDSGVTHLAAATGCAVVALFGPTAPSVWRPRGGTVRVVASRDLASIPVEQVLEAIDGAGDILAARGRGA